jgi:ribosomal protein L11 methyltransferase
MPDTAWTRLTIKVPSTLEDPLADFLSTLTGRGVCIHEADSGSTIEAYISPEQRQDHLLRINNLLESFVHMKALDREFKLQQEEVPEEDWMEVFRSQHTTVRVSDRLLIRPTWCDPTGNGEIVLDPGLAFGTGSHPSTRMCLVLLDSVVSNPAPERMLDLGTGSGILAIAGARLGIRDVFAVDIDPVAVHVTKENAQKNDVGNLIRTAEGSIDQAEGLFDIITANIAAGPLERLAPQIAKHVKPGGHLILSGILEEEIKPVVNAFTACGLERVEVMTEKVWAAALFVLPKQNE